MLIDINTHTFPKLGNSFLSPEQMITETKWEGLEVLNGPGPDAENAFALDVSKYFKPNGRGATNFFHTIKTVEELII